MRTIRKTVSVAVMAVLLLLAAAPSAQAEDPSPLQRYREQAIEVESSLSTGLTLYRGDEEQEVGFFGGGAAELFAGSELALENARTHRRLRIAGFALWVLGTAALIAEIVVLLASEDMLVESGANGERQLSPAFWGWLIPSGIVGLTGALMLTGANGYLTDAVRIHNRQLYRRLTEPPTAMLRWQHAF